MLKPTQPELPRTEMEQTAALTTKKRPITLDNYKTSVIGASLIKKNGRTENHIK